MDGFTYEMYEAEEARRKRIDDREEYEINRSDDEWEDMKGGMAYQQSNRLDG